MKKRSRFIVFALVLCVGFGAHAEFIERCPSAGYNPEQKKPLKAGLTTSSRVPFSKEDQSGANVVCPGGEAYRA